MATNTQFFPVFRFRSVAQLRHILVTGLMPLGHPDYFNDPFDASRKSLHEYFEFIEGVVQSLIQVAPETVNAITTAIKKRNEISPNMISFNINVVNPLMWAHYSNKSAGIAVEFDAAALKRTGMLGNIIYQTQYARLIDNDVFMNKQLEVKAHIDQMKIKIEQEIQNNNLSREDISSKRTQLLSVASELIAGLIAQFSIKPYYIKHASWTYEEEVRFTVPHIYTDMQIKEKYPNDIPQKTKRSKESIERANNSFCIEHLASAFEMDTFDQEQKNGYQAFCLRTHNDDKSVDHNKMIPITGIYFGMKTPIKEILEIISYVETNFNKRDQDKIKFYQCTPHDVKMEVEARPFRVHSIEDEPLKVWVENIVKAREIKEGIDGLKKQKVLLESNRELKEITASYLAQLNEELSKKEDKLKNLPSYDFGKTPITELNEIRERYGLNEL